MIERTLLLQAANNNAMVASDRTVGQIVASVEAFKVDGVFNPDQYKVVLANAGYTPERFRRDQVQQIILSQLQDGVLSSDFISQTELAAAAEATAEERDIRYLIIPDERLSAGLEVAEEAMLQVYEAEPDRWTSEPSVIAEYIELSRADFIQPVDEELLEQQFESVREECSLPNRR